MGGGGIRELPSIGGLVAGKEAGEEPNPKGGMRETHLQRYLHMEDPGLPNIFRMGAQAI